VLLLLL
jgi:hypothetical protein